VVVSVVPVRPLALKTTVLAAPGMVCALVPARSVAQFVLLPDNPLQELSTLPFQ
jgi:hypothetical protein